MSAPHSNRNHRSRRSGSSQNRAPSPHRPTDEEWGRTEGYDPLLRFDVPDEEDSDTNDDASRAPSHLSSSLYRPPSDARGGRYGGAPGVYAHPINAPHMNGPPMNAGARNLRPMNAMPINGLNLYIPPINAPPGNGPMNALPVDGQSMTRPGGYGAGPMNNAPPMDARPINAPPMNAPKGYGPSLPLGYGGGAPPNKGVSPPLGYGADLAPNNGARAPPPLLNYGAGPASGFGTGSPPNNGTRAPPPPPRHPYANIPAHHPRNNNPGGPRNNRPRPAHNANGNSDIDPRYLEYAFDNLTIDDREDRAPLLSGGRRRSKPRRRRHSEESGGGESCGRKSHGKRSERRYAIVSPRSEDDCIDEKGDVRIYESGLETHHVGYTWAGDTKVEWRYQGEEWSGH